MGKALSSPPAAGGWVTLLAYIPGLILERAEAPRDSRAVTAGNRRNNLNKRIFATRPTFVWSDLWHDNDIRYEYNNN